MFKDKETIIFDFDGTLVDSSKIWKEAHYETIMHFGGNIEYSQKDDMWKYINSILHDNKHSINPYGILISEIISEYKLNTSFDEYFKKIMPIGEKGYSNFVDLKNNVLELLKLLKKYNYKMVLATNSYRKNVDDFFKSTKYNDKNLKQYFDLILTHDDVEKKKPDPEIYLKVLETLKLDSKKCLVFEDSLMGLYAAKNANYMEVCGVYDIESENEREIISSKADYYIKDFSEVISELVKFKQYKSTEDRFMRISLNIANKHKKENVLDI